MLGLVILNGSREPDRDLKIIRRVPGAPRTREPHSVCLSLEDGDHAPPHLRRELGHLPGALRSPDAAEEPPNPAPKNESARDRRQDVREIHSGIILQLRLRVGLRLGEEHYRGFSMVIDQGTDIGEERRPAV